VLRGSRFWPDHNALDGFDHLAAPLGTELLP
jgi:myo-inositol-1(or 4)-monophosphatase